MKEAKRILVLGSTGLVGSRFVELYSFNETLLTPDASMFDITHKESVTRYLNRNKPNTIINFAAYTDVNGAELERGDESGLCWQLNCNAVKYLATLASEYDSHLIHISTDMVFSGSVQNKGPYKEVDIPEDDPDKVTWYGYSKFAGEKHVDVENSTLVRIIYPVRAHFEPKLDYFRKLLQLYDTDKLFPLFYDQYFSITFIDDLCLALFKIIEDRLTGIFHVSSPDITTPHKIMSMLIERTRHFSGGPASSSIKSITNYVRYPQYGGLDPSFTMKKLNIQFRSTQQIIEELISQGIGKEKSP